MPQSSPLKTIASALLPVIAEVSGNANLATGFLVATSSKIFIISSEHESIAGKRFYCVLPCKDMTASAATDQLQWLPLKIEHFLLDRHQVVLSFSNPTDQDTVCAAREPLPFSQIVDAALACQGDDVSSLGFWSKHPDLSATFRRGYVASEGNADFLTSIKIVHGNSGAPVWRTSDGKILGTAQKNLFDVIKLTQPLGNVRELDSYSDLIVTTSLDRAMSWIQSQS